MIHAFARRAAILTVFAGTGLALLTGCSSSPSGEATTSRTPTSGGAATSSPQPTARASKSGASSVSTAAGECTDASILAALPAGSTMVKYQCAIASPTMWAAARVKPGPTVFFLQNTSGPWKVSTSDKVCGATSASLPPEIKAYCPKA